MGFEELLFLFISLIVILGMFGIFISAYQSLEYLSPILEALKLYGRANFEPVIFGRIKMLFESF